MKLSLNAEDAKAALAWQQDAIAALPEQVSEQYKQQFADLSRVAVVGGGAMGRCIAIAFLRLGKQVMLVDPQADSLANAEHFITRYVESQVKKGRLTEDDAQRWLKGIHFSSELAHVEGSALVVEAVPEELALKQKVMQSITSFVADDCILATNTSTLDLDAIADAVQQPERVVGTHFFIPAHVTKLLELVPAKATSKAVLEQVKAMALAMKKVFVVAGNCDGFIGNRLFDRFHQEAMYLLEEGATPAQVDQALEAWGMAIGPFKALDMVGNDIPWQVRCQRKAKNPELIQPRVGDALCEQGRFGQKTGSGWYDYRPGSRNPEFSQATRELLERVSDELGLHRKAISDDMIVQRCILSLVNEGAAIIREGYADGPSDIDLTFVNGYGFPAQQGGPMYWAEMQGLDQVIHAMEEIAPVASFGDHLWQPDQWLVVANRTVTAK